MRIAGRHSHREGPTLLCAPLGWDCFGKNEESFSVSFRKRFMNPISVSPTLPKTNSARVRTVS